MSKSVYRKHVCNKRFKNYLYILNEGREKKSSDLHPRKHFRLGKHNKLGSNFCGIFETLIKAGREEGLKKLNLPGTKKKYAHNLLNLSTYIILNIRCLESS